MPFIYDPNLDEQQKQDQGAQNVQISGASPNMDSGGTTGQKSGPEAAPNTGSGFQNLDKYLNTNSSQNLGSQISGNIQGKIDTAKHNFDTVGQSFSDKVQGANQLPNQQDVNGAITNASTFDPKTFQSWENQTYKGPNSLAESQDDYNKYWSGTNQAKTEANLLGNEGGRFSLLDTYFGKPNYNFGQKSLDNLLIQQQPGLGNKTQDLQSQAAQLQSQGNQKSQQLQDQVSQRVGQIDQSRNMVRNAVGIDANNQVITDPNAEGYGAIGKSYAGVNDALTKANSGRDAAQSQLISNLSNRNITADEYNKLGLTGPIQLFNLDPTSSRYLTPSSPLTKEQVMTPEQQSYIRALSKLAGVQDTFANNDLQSAPAGYAYNTDRLMSDIAQAKQDYQNHWNNDALELPQLNPGDATTIGQAGWGQRMGARGMNLGQMRDYINQMALHAYDYGNREGADQQAFINYASPAVAAAEAALNAKYRPDSYLSVDDQNQNPSPFRRKGP